VAWALRTSGHGLLLPPPVVPGLEELDPPRVSGVAATGIAVLLPEVALGASLLRKIPHAEALLVGTGSVPGFLAPVAVLAAETGLLVPLLQWVFGGVE